MDGYPIRTDRNFCMRHIGCFCDRISIVFLRLILFQITKCIGDFFKRKWNGIAVGWQGNIYGRRIRQRSAVNGGNAHTQRIRGIEITVFELFGTFDLHRIRCGSIRYIRIKLVSRA